jgi:anthranilate synthase/aminodeoxychorismate synthase-like glutamine amidotransferase
MLLMIDNYDSFTYNLVQYFLELKQDVKVFRNDKIGLEEISRLKPRYLVISPGPCTPNEAGISMQAIQHFAGKLPILGVCLGHQSMAQVLGSRIIRANRVMHGKTSPVIHTGQGLFAGLANPLQATRYHSLVVEAGTLPADFEVTAWTENEQGEQDEIMAIQHRSLPMTGVQFHPESILTEQGHQLLANFLAMGQ